MAIDYEVRDDGIAIVTMNNPAKMNALDKADLDRISEVFEDLRVNPQVQVGVVTGAGGQAFTSGMDWNVVKGEGGTSGDERYAESPGGLMLNMVPYMKGIEIWKPLIAAINGHCIALGACMVLGCDIRLASPNATFGLIEPTWGGLADGGAIARLPRQIPYAHAMDILLTGRMINADEMLRFGIINEVLPQQDLVPRALEIAEIMVTRCNPLAVQITKQAVVRGLDMGQGQALIEEALYAEMLNNRLQHGGGREEHARRFQR